MSNLCRLSGRCGRSATLSQNYRSNVTVAPQSYRRTRRAWTRSRAYACVASTSFAGITKPSLQPDSSTASTDLLHWACDGWAPDPAAAPATAAAPTLQTSQQPSQPHEPYQPPLRVGVRDLGPGRGGRGLVALADVAPGEVLLSVPLTRVFCSQPDSDLHWSADMAVRLLRARHRAARAATKAATPAAASAAGKATAATEIAQGTASAAATTVIAGLAATETTPAPQEERQDEPDTSKAAQGTGGEEEDDNEEEVDWGPWIAALPASVRTPLEYDDAEVRQLGCPYVIEEVRAVQQCIRDCYEVVQPELAALGCGWEDFLWAVQIFHSRCFFEPASGRHLCVPGVDMANHCAQAPPSAATTSTFVPPASVPSTSSPSAAAPSVSGAPAGPPASGPSAAVRLQHSAAACQGWQALAEVAEAPPLEPSRFLLVAGEEGIRAGSEVTISYGSWPSEAFLLLFGFVPSPPAATAAAAATVHAAAAASSAEQEPACAGPRSAPGLGAERAEPSPGDCLVLFRGAEEAVRWCLARAAAGAWAAGTEAGAAARGDEVWRGQPLQEGLPGEECEGASDERMERVVGAVLDALAMALPDDDFVNLVVTPEGVDSRIETLLNVLFSGPLKTHIIRPSELLKLRIQERLSHFNLAGVVANDDAVRVFLRSKQAVARRVLQSMV